ncbi:MULTISPECIES: C39 family peptidase [Paraliobacillus]|uniref:C39 family peptidase n=1 Tax=Paraliobacillus TaxID=200903 RepID=UPI000DD3BAA4|nr:MULTISPECIES: C39 family peptidase [Paraliobacillus]
MLFVVLLIISLSLTVLLVYYAKQTRSQIHFYAFRIYGILFGLCSITLVFMLFNTNKLELTTWLELHTTSRTYAHEKESLIVEPIVENEFNHEAFQIEVPVIGQYPQLPRGCEVTSLAMLLNYAGIDVDKMELANKIRKDSTPYKETKQQIYFGNPNQGFVGDMYDLSNPGYGVYHKPIADLAKTYLKDSVHDFSGSLFDQILYYISQGQPVWVITNATFEKLAPNAFQKWETPQGPVTITMREHSVLVTGYDQEYIYFNDPLNATKRKVSITSFEEAWIQMGRQAITILP